MEITLLRRKIRKHTLIWVMVGWGADHGIRNGWINIPGCNIGCRLHISNRTNQCEIWAALQRAGFILAKYLLAVVRRIDGMRG